MIFGTAVATGLLIVGQVLVGLRLFGDQTPQTASELLWTRRLTWIAVAVFGLTLAATLVAARDARLSWSESAGVVVIGAVAGGLLCVGVLMALFS